MNAIIVDGVRCTKLSAKKLQLEVPQAMSGDQLKKWQDKNRQAVIQKLEESEEEKEEPISNVRKRVPLQVILL